MIIIKLEWRWNQARIFILPFRMSCPGLWTEIYCAIYIITGIFYWYIRICHHFSNWIPDRIWQHWLAEHWRYLHLSNVQPPPKGHTLFHRLNVIHSNIFWNGPLVNTYSWQAGSCAACRKTIFGRTPMCKISIPSVISFNLSMWQ